MQNCPVCGTPLQPAAKFCPNCAQPISQHAIPMAHSYSVPSAQSFPMQESTSTPASVPQPPSFTENFGEFGSMTTTAPDSQPPSSLVSSLQHTSLPLSTSSPGPSSLTSTPEASAYVSSPYQASNMMTPGMYTPPPEMPARRKLPPWLLFILLILLLFTVGSGAWLTYYAGFELPALADAQATTTAQDAERTAQAQATATTQAFVNATSTASTQATVQAQQTATALQNIYTQATSGTPVLQSSLDSQDSANWETYSAQGGGGCFFTDGALHANVQRQNYYVPCFALATNFGNMAFEVEMTIISGDEGGLIFRGNNDTTRFYYFRVGRDGLVALYATQSNNQSLNLFYGRVSAIKTGMNQTNIVTIIARSNTIYMYVNKQYAGQVQDSTYSSGQIGLLAGDLTGATDVAYKNARVWQL